MSTSEFPNNDRVGLRLFRLTIAEAREMGASEIIFQRRDDDFSITFHIGSTIYDRDQPLIRFWEPLRKVIISLRDRDTSGAATDRLTWPVEEPRLEIFDPGPGFVPLPIPCTWIIESTNDKLHLRHVASD